MRRALASLICLLTSGCGAAIVSEAAYPTARIDVAPTATIGLPRRTATAQPTALPDTAVPPPATPEPPTATAVSEPATALDQFRLWMEEARAVHPYSEPVEKMWAVMVCESSGNPDIVGAGLYHGLFQYSQQTWAGEWNPYRDQPILDPRAQIFATAKAWQDGNQGWWGCY